MQSTWRTLYHKLILSITNNISVQNEAKRLIGKLSIPGQFPESGKLGKCMTPSTIASILLDIYHESYRIHKHKHSDTISNVNSNTSNNNDNDSNRGSDTNSISNNSDNTSTSNSINSNTANDKG